MADLAVNSTFSPAQGTGLALAGLPLPWPERPTLTERSRLLLEAATARAGKGLKGRAALEAGHEVMKAAARV
jgi:hypothetical protein